MGGELERINPTVVEGAEDIFGAEVALSPSRPGNWGRRTKGRKGNTMTHAQVAQLRRHLNAQKSRKKAEMTHDDRDMMSSGMERTLRQRKRSQKRAETMNAQGYDDKLDESLGGRDGAESTKSQSRRSRRRESKGMEKSMGRRPYSGVRTMDAQGYDDKLDESLGGRDGAESTKSQSRRSRRRESKGMEKSMGRRPYSGVRTMDSETFETHEQTEANQDFIENWKSENFEAPVVPVSDENMVDEGSVDAAYGGGVNVDVSGDDITTTTNPSVNEAFDVGNEVGVDVAEQEVMNVNPSVDAQYGDGTMSAEGSDIVDTVQNLTDKVGFRINGWVASAIVIGLASVAGYRYAKR